jgi:hypothetical protein
MTMFDPDARDRVFVNHLNEIVRHCRIGRVKMKIDIRGWERIPRKGWFHDPMKPAPTPFFSGGYVHTSRTDGVPA